jgi:enoyl-[acyl-carrier protein] reductase II
MNSPALISELLHIDYPLIQGGMAWVSDAGLAAAVSNAGGLGVIAAGNAPAEAVREQIRRIRTLTGKPFGVNVMLLSPYADEVAHMLACEQVPVVITGAGDPEKYVAAWKKNRSRVLTVVASTALALRMEACGVDALIAEGSVLLTMRCIQRTISSIG